MYILDRFSKIELHVSRKTLRCLTLTFAKIICMYSLLYTLAANTTLYCSWIIFSRRGT